VQPLKGKDGGDPLRSKINEAVRFFLLSVLHFKWYWPVLYVVSSLVQLMEMDSSDDEKRANQPGTSKPSRKRRQRVTKPAKGSKRSLSLAKHLTDDSEEDADDPPEPTAAKKFCEFKSRSCFFTS